MERNEVAPITNLKGFFGSLVKPVSGIALIELHPQFPDSLGRDDVIEDYVSILYKAIICALDLVRAGQVAARKALTVYSDHALHVLPGKETAR
jgi:hypothetical protein